MDFSFFF
ncbi:HSP20-like chaperones superfamily protein [Zea mays]|nr:HSP20-like chaperones superfamily protein [Zea mays]